ncbi:MAG: hypothetical protein WB729_05275 [Candidatus Sulfotelmatobacter sp.]
MRLALADGGGAAERVDVPELGVGGEIFDADFALHLCAGAAQPDYAELGFDAFVLHVDQIAGLELSVDGLEGCTATADGTQAGGLGEGTPIGVHAPDLYGKFDENTRLTATIHSYEPR